MKPRRFYKALRRRAHEQLEDVNTRLEALELLVDQEMVTGEYELPAVSELPELETEDEARPERTR